MKRKQKKILARIILAALIYITLTVLLRIFSPPEPLPLLLNLLPYFVVGYDVLLKAFRNILGGRVFDENFLMCIATVGAFCIGEYLEAVFVMLFYQIGELFQSIAVGKSRRSISSLMDIKPDSAVLLKDGEECVVEPEELQIGDTVVVRAGEKIPIDGIITKGNAELDCRALTGESEPVYAECGSRVVGGCINLNGALHIEATSKYEDSTVSKILELVENASSLKSKTDRFITRFATYYTPIVVMAALLVFLVPTFLFGQATVWLGRALIFLVISCPCALVISVPLSYFGGIGAASKNGILVKGAVYLEQMAQVSEVVFDKTGTLTKGAFEVFGVYSVTDENTLYSIARTIEAGSTHPIAKAVARYSAEHGGQILDTQNVTEIAGMGITAEIDGAVYFAGNAKLAKSYVADLEITDVNASTVYVGKKDLLFGCLAVKDAVREESARAIKELRKLGVKQTVMLSGDKKERAKEIADQLDIDVAIGELLPSEKVEQVEKRLAQLNSSQRLVYVGDGINDAPVLSRADVGISLGAIGSDAAIEAADIVLMDDDPLKVALTLKIAKSTKRIVIQNIVFALGVKLSFMILGVFGIANLWTAVFADVGVSVIAILNAMRTLNLK